MYNEELKIIDTQEKAYFLGQAFGDGCNQYLKKYKFSLASIDTDSELYKQIQSYFPFLKYKIYKSSPNMVRLECYYKKFSLDLKALGLTQNKCEQDKIGNFNIPKISKELMPHFIRGLFDADGSVYTPTRYRSRNNIRVQFTFGAKNFCKQLVELLESKNIKLTYREKDKIVWGKHYNSYDILISSRAESLKFADYIYKDATLFLDRKKKVFESYIYSPKQELRKFYPKCPVCGGIPKGNGQRNGRKRLICKSCGRHYDVILPLI